MIERHSFVSTNNDGRGLVVGEQERAVYVAADGQMLEPAAALAFANEIIIAVGGIVDRLAAQPVAVPKDVRRALGAG